MSVLLAFMFVFHMLGALGGRKRMLDPLDLEYGHW